MSVQKCPYCGHELEHGAFHSRGRNFFFPDGEKMPSWYTKKAMEKRNAIMLPPDPFAMDIPPQWPEAYLCRTCKIIYIPYE